MILRIFLFATLAFAGTTPAAIESVSVDSDSVTIAGTSTTGQLHELRPHQRGADTARTHQLVLADDGAFQLTLPRRADYDRIDSRWQLASGGHAVWASDVTRAAAYPGLQPMVAKTRKGLGGIHPDPRLFQDLVDLGIGHITVNITLQEIFSPAQLRQLDQLLTFAHENGIVATAILLVPPRGSVLSHPDCDPSAMYSLPNLTSSEGADAFASCVRFLAERYCKPGFPHGRITHWIVGNEVDAAWVWTNAGEKGAAEYMEEYQRVLRVAYYSVRRFDPNGKVFISLTHHWNSAHQPDPKRFYKPRDLLNQLREHCAQSGDFEWGLAFHPYPDDLFNPRTWEDKLATDTPDTTLITMKNIEVLDRFMQQPAFRYRGEKVRTVLLSEQGYHTDRKDPQGEELQARAIAYAWERLQPLESIEAFHYHRWIDHEREGGLHLGLWTVQKGSITWPERKKRSWQVYRDLERAPQNLERENLVAWCIVPFDAKQRGPAERAAMLHRLGLRRCAYDWRDQHVAEFEEEILEYKRHGIEYFAFWGGHEKAFELFEKYGIHPQIWHTAPSPEGATLRERVAAAADQMEPLARRCAEIGSKLGLYNHGGWGGEPANLVAVCEELHRRGHPHVGIVYNWHHAHEHISDWPQVLGSIQPHLLCLNLNGMNAAAQPKILALGNGAHEAAMLETLRKSGYSGPIGILDHRNELDTELALRENLEGLDRLLGRGGE